MSREAAVPHVVLLYRGDTHKVASVVGPFDTRGAASDWAVAMAQYAGCEYDLNAIVSAIPPEAIPDVR